MKSINADKRPNLALSPTITTAIPTATAELEDGSKEEESERFLTFGPFPEIRPGFSWIKTFFDPASHVEEGELCLEVQKEMRAAVVRNVDFSAIESALDFGCGYGSDVIRWRRSTRTSA